MTWTCPACGSDKRPRRSRNKYCSVRCSEVGRRRIDRDLALQLSEQGLTAVQMTKFIPATDGAIRAALMKARQAA